MTKGSAVVLLSGELDSLTALAWALEQGYIIRNSLSYTYGQLHAREVEAAAAIAEHYRIPHESVALTAIGGSQLTDPGHVPKGRDLDAIVEDVAPTYVPNRNMILISYAAASALLGDAVSILGGWNATDASNYPDCRDDFLGATQRDLRLATLRPFEILRPLINDPKPSIAQRALDLKAPIHLTWTCYMGEEEACGLCDACQMRVSAFKRIGMIDPIPYAIEITWAGCNPYPK